jgi:hypothetical protein
VPTIWIPNDNGQDFDPAREFGNIAVLTEGDIRHRSVTEHWQYLNDIMLDSTPDDMLVVSGPASIASMAAAILMRRHGHLNVLLYSRGAYYQYSLPNPIEEKAT